MKYCIFVALLMLGVSCFGQVRKKNTVAPMLACPGKMPVPPENYMEYFSEHFKLCDSFALEPRRIIFRFDVYEDGSVHNATIIKGPDCCRKEFLEVFTNMPKWKPVVVNGKPIKYKNLSLPISIHIE
jgi:hypothetical protein